MRRAIALGICALTLAVLSGTAAAFSNAGNASVLRISKGDLVVFDGTPVLCFVYGPAGAVPGKSGILCTPGRFSPQGVLQFTHSENAGWITLCCVGNNTSTIEFGKLTWFIDVDKPLKSQNDRRTFHVPLHSLVRLQAEHAGSTVACTGVVGGSLDSRPHVSCFIVVARTVKLIPSGIAGAYISGTKPTTDSDRQHHGAFVVHGDTGMLVDLYESDTIRLPKGGTARRDYQWAPGR